MTANAFALFDTEIGPCGIAWNGRGVAGVRLPEHGEAATLARMRQRFPDARAPRATIRERQDLTSARRILSG